MDADVVIVGGGLAGLATACGLEAAGRSYRLIEQRSLPVSDGMGIVLHPNGLHALSQLGVDYRHLNDYVPLTHMVFGTPRRNRVVTQPVGYRGYPVVSASRPTLHQLLYRHVDQNHCLSNTRVISSVREGGATRLTLSSGKMVIARDVVLADGINGLAREIAKQQHSKQGVWRWVISDGSEPRHAYEIHNGKYRLGVFPISPTSTYVFLCSQPCKFDLESQFRTPQLREILMSFGDLGHRVSDAMSEETPIRFDAISESEVHWMTSSGNLRIGDSAHAISPNLGMGASLAFEDAATLVHLLGNHSRERIDQTLIRTYILARDKRVRAIKSYSNLFGRIAHLRGNPLNHLKFTSMKLLSNIPFFDNANVIYKPYFQQVQNCN